MNSRFTKSTWEGPLKNLNLIAGFVALFAASSLTAQTTPAPAKTAAPAAAPSATTTAPAPATSLAPATAPADVTNPALRDELAAMKTEDLDLRKQLMAHMDDTTLRAQVIAQDAKHVARLREIVKQFGWPGNSMVGPSGSQAAWVIVLHGPKDLLAEMMPTMKDAAAKGELAKSLVASSEDRELINEGKKQVYGTQFDTHDGKFEPYPIDDPEHVDDRRKAVGLGSLSDYTEAMRKAYHIPSPATATGATNATPAATGTQASTPAMTSTATPPPTKP
jgi:hypothetical protein